MNERIASTTEAEALVNQKLDKAKQELDFVLKSLFENDWFSLNLEQLERSQSASNKTSSEQIRSMIEVLLLRYIDYENDVLLPLRTSYDNLFQQEIFSNKYRTILGKLRRMINLLLFKGKINRKSLPSLRAKDTEIFVNRSVLNHNKS